MKRSTREMRIKVAKLGEGQGIKDRSRRTREMEREQTCSKREALYTREKAKD